ncbi:DUF3375 domain-containing protein [Actinomadura rugatobispora]|uniref:DUF3375 domain-containing protein n=1 Tax=Actinomadura rugatobispora TaxID=1994 RepID=A0ABW1ADI0_9ACTN|nr:DUF3375 domain-containing protein [Actinomadura rugatobispora]
MAAKSAEQFFHEFRTGSAADVAMSLLRSKHALVSMALMAAHLGDGQIVDGISLTAMLDEDLPALERGLTSGEHDADDPVQLGAERMLTTWVKKGWVHRSIDAETRTERYQLTTGAAHAVRQMRGLRQQSSVATQSALSMVMAELRQIATESDPDPNTRRRAIDEQITVLAAQRDRIDGGEAVDVDAGELIDRVAAVAQLVERIPADLARYGEQMHANTAMLLRQSLSDDPAEFAQTLDRMFAGHDVIADSPEGQAFRAFATLVGTPSQRAQLESDIDAILTQLEGLPDHLAEILRGFINAMWQRVEEVEQTRGIAFRRMSTFVRGGDAAHYRGMRTRISEAQALAADAFQVTHGGRDIGFPIPMSGADTSSVGRLRLDEGSPAAPDPVIDSGDEFDIDPAALAGRESIDWLALRDAVHAAMAAHGDIATLPEVLEHLPGARTGDIIAVWSLANRYGEVDRDAQVSVLAHTDRGPREITLPYLVFGEPIPDPTVPTSHEHARPGQLSLLEGDSG